MGHTIETDRLLLQPLNQSHFDFMLELEAITESYEYDRDTPLSPDEVKEGCHWFIEKVKSLPKEGAIRWIVIYNGASIGEVHVNCISETNSEWEIGWHFLPECWGKGFATEAAAAIIKYAFTYFKIHRIIAMCCTENLRSVALAERVGMQKDGRMRENKLLRGKYYDEYVLSILKREIKTSV